MKITFDEGANAAYIYFSNSKKTKGTVKKTIPLEPSNEGPELFVDIDKNNKIIGIEILDASLFLPEEIIKRAEKIG